MSKPFLRVTAGLLWAALVNLQSHPAAAAWPGDPTHNVPLCTAAGDQMYPTIVGDGSGGVIVAWQDQRNGTDSDIYAQHVLAMGVVDPAWPAGGRALCQAAYDQYEPKIVSDGAGGAIAVWTDYRSGTTSQIYAQRVLASGDVDPAWPPDGRALCPTAYTQSLPVIISAGIGGAIVAWTDYRNGPESDIYAHHVLASGVVDPAWPTGGRILCGAANAQDGPAIVADDAGGAIVAWQDLRGGVYTDIYAQHVLSGGAVDPAWPADGRAACIAPLSQFLASTFSMVTDGAGGAIVTWEDERCGSDSDIYAQHLRADGTAAPAWPEDGRALCTAADTQDGARAVADGSGGAIVCWRDLRSSLNLDIYGQHVMADGTVDPAWPAQGRALCTAADDQLSRAIVTDGAGGAIVAWRDFRNGIDDDIYAQHVQAGGAVDPLWPADGRALCTAAGGQAWPEMVADGAGGAIVCWDDLRNGIDDDVYAQRVQADGQLGGSLVGVPEPESAEIRFALDAVRPNPSRGGALAVSFMLPTPAAAALELYDIAGRRIAASAVGALGPGRHSVRLGEGSRITPGVYLVRLTQAGRSLARRVAVLP